MRLYEIDEKLQQAWDGVYMDESTGELLGMEAVNLLKLEEESTLLGLGKYAKGLEAELDAVNREADSLIARGKSMRKKLDRIYSIIQERIKPEQVLEDSQCVLKLRKCAPSVRIVDEKLLPPGFMRTKTTTEPDKISICEVLKGGNKVPGAELVTNYSLQIR